MIGIGIEIVFGLYRIIDKISDNKSLYNAYGQTVCEVVALREKLLELQNKED